MFIDVQVEMISSIKLQNIGLKKIDEDDYIIQL